MLWLEFLCHLLAMGIFILGTYATCRACDEQILIKCYRIADSFFRRAPHTETSSGGGSLLTALTGNSLTVNRQERA